MIQSPNLVAMEDLPINNNNGQSYGFLLYRKVKLFLSISLLEKDDSNNYSIF